jgi:hypothetical protein
MMKIETRIVKKGETFFVLKNGQELTAPTDFYFVIVKDGETELLNRVFEDPIIAGDAVKSAEAFYSHLIKN